MARPTWRSKRTRFWRSSRSERAATQSSRAAANSGPEKLAQMASSARVSRSFALPVRGSSATSSAARRFARCATAAMTRSAFVG